MTKYALCIGINNYPGTNRDLSGCVNDADDWSQVLESKNFTVKQLKDGEATKASMIEGIRELVLRAKQGDLIMLTYSGHGTWVPDTDNDENDGKDEALCPHDINSAGALTDDELYDIFDQMERDVRSVFISDSCHSGSVSRMAPRALAADDEKAPRIRFLEPHRFLSEEEMKVADMMVRRRSVGAKRPHRGVLLSGCQDHQLSYDAWFGDRPNGAFTRAALQALQGIGEDATYRDWHEEIRMYLPSSSYPQSPMLQGTRSQRRWKLFE